MQDVIRHVEVHQAEEVGHDEAGDLAAPLRLVLGEPQRDLPALHLLGVARSQQRLDRGQGARRAEEMREVASTVGESGLSPWMSSACAERQQWAAQFRELAAQEPLEAMLDRLLAAAAEK